MIDNFGNLINPLLVKRNVHGVAVQGIGQAQFEQVIYDEDDQVFTVSFMDYAMLRADNVTMIYFDTKTTVSLQNLMGMTDCDEASTVGALAAITNVVQDAIWDLDMREVQMPFNRYRVWQILQRSNYASD